MAFPVSIVENGFPVSVDGVTENNLIPELRDKINESKQATDFINGVLGKNLFNSVNFVENSFVANDVGTINSAVGWARTGKITVLPSTVYTISGIYAIAPVSFAIRFETSSNVFISHISNNNNTILYPFTFTTPVNCTQIIFTIKHSNYETTVVNAAKNIQLELGAIATSFEEYNISLTDKLNEKIQKVDLVFTGGKNLFNPALGTDGFFIENTGFVSASALYGYTDYIQVEPNQTYTGWDGINGMRKSTYYNAAKAVISGGNTNNHTSFTIPTNGVAYVRVSYYVARKGSFQFEKATTATEYESYSPKVIESINGGIINQGSTNTKTITLQKIERVMFFGDSYTEQYNTLPGKGYPAILSMFTDWNVENYSKSGDNYDEILTRIKTNNATYKSLGIKTFTGGGYAFLISFTNDNNDGIINSTDQLNSYVTNLKNVISAVKSLGYKPVVCTEYHNISGVNGALLMQSVLSKVASDEGAIFADVYEKARFLRGTDNSLFWDGSHPGVRSNGLFWTSLLPYINSLPRPRWGIKVFRVRASTTVSSISDLMYPDILQRVLKYKEIFVTQRAIANTHYSYYDAQTAFGSAGQPSQVIGEYLDLINTNTINTGNYTLIEYVINATVSNTTALKLFVGNTSATVYVKDHINQSWVELTNTGGTVTLNDLQSQLEFDKVSLLLYGASGITLSAPSIEFTGTEGKSYYTKSLPRDFRSEELISTPLITTTSGWTTTGTVTPSDASDSNYPIGVTKIVTITNSNSIKQTVTFSAVDYKRKVQLKIIARGNPAVYSSGSTYPTGAAITDDTYDFPTVKVNIIKSTSTATFKEVVSLHWTEAIFEFDVAANETTFDIVLLYEDKNYEFAKITCKIE